MSKYHTHTEHRTGSTGYARCFETHKPLPIGEYLIYGGSCSSPMVSNADVYIGFDRSMKETANMYPWNEKKVEEILFYIPDMGVPADAAEFKKMIAWIALQLIALKLVHIGCIGGHGRTGMVLAALVTHMTGESDSISYVRKHYCEKAVESSAQVRFLNTHYGIKEISGAKEYAGGHGSKDWYAEKGYPTASNPTNFSKLPPLPQSIPKGKQKVQFTTNPLCIWGDSIKFVKPEKCDIIESIQERV